MKVTVLGCGGSGGVPLIGCRCAVCCSADPRNTRSRVSILVESSAGTRILVDASPDLRQQFLANGITTVDAVILTHAHADHLHGIDDLRSVNFHRNAPLDVWGDRETIAQATRRFDYAFEAPRTNKGSWYAPSLVPRVIEGAAVQVRDIAVTTFNQIHGGSRPPTLGLRFGRFAYSTDVLELPEAAFAALEGIDVWIVDCLQEAPSPAHSHLAQTLGWIARVKPRRAILTHMNHHLDYAALAAKLPRGVEPGRDGLVIDVAEL
ncbi:MAG: MBL fold metallo-hydrolase [Alphaproteobacteria bacterium]|nr:MBL fold metallo-hydrolase [Alphaproteobacteria bacterium]